MVRSQRFRLWCRPLRTAQPLRRARIRGSLRCERPYRPFSSFRQPPAASLATRSTVTDPCRLPSIESHPAVGRYAEFSERQFEQAVNLELLGGIGGAQFSVPTQRDEAELGYDVAMIPALDAIWPMLGREAPRGVRARRGILSHRSAPTFAASLFIQYKRPEILRGRRAREAQKRAAIGADPCLPYFRYELPEPQLQTLLDLSVQVGEDAVICYSAPAFVSIDRLCELQLLGAVLGMTDFVPLSELAPRISAAPPGAGNPHVWTYGGPGRAGVLCSDPESLASWNIETLREILVDKLQTEPRSPEDHLVGLVSGVREWASESPSEDDSFDLDWLLRRPWRIWNGPLHPMLALDIQSALFRKGIGWIMALAWPRGRSED